MADDLDMQRVLCGHLWKKADEWATALSRLADLTDEQIVGLTAAERGAGGQGARARR
jgi:hypothetical protein